MIFVLLLLACMHGWFAEDETEVETVEPATTEEPAEYTIAVATGWIDTELNLGFIESMPDPEAFRLEIHRIHPVARTGTPEEVAAHVAFLAAEEAGFVARQVYTVDGGRMEKLSLP